MSSTSSLISQPPESLGDFRLGRELGRGGFGTVFEAFNAATGESVAIKRVSLANVKPDELEGILEELRLLQRLEHPNIVQYKGMIRTAQYLYIVLELVENGSLAAAIKRFGVFSEKLAALYVSQVLRGLVYLHSQGVVHRDIKGGNLLLNKVCTPEEPPRVPQVARTLLRHFCYRYLLTAAEWMLNYQILRVPCV